MVSKASPMKFFLLTSGVEQRGGKIAYPPGIRSQPSKKLRSLVYVITSSIMEFRSELSPLIAGISATEDLLNSATRQSSHLKL